MSSWFSCCCGSRKELPPVDPIQPKVGSTAPRESPPLRVTRVAERSSLGNTALQGADPLQSYLFGYQSMGTTPLPGRSLQGRSLARQSTEPIIRIAVSSLPIPEPSSAPITVSVQKDESRLLRQETSPVLYEISPLQRDSSETSEPPALARSVSVVSQVDSQIGILQSQIRSLQTERETFAKKNRSLEEEVEQSQAKQEETEKAREAVKAELEAVRKETIKLLQRNAQLEKRLAISKETVARQGKEQFLQSPLSPPTERRGSLSDIEEEEGDQWKKEDRTPTLVQVQQELAKMESRYQRAARHLKELKGKLEGARRENNRLEMELQTNKDRVAELEFRLEQALTNLDKRERAKSDIEKRGVAVEKAEEHQVQGQVREKELEKQLQDAEETVQQLREQAKKLCIQRDKALQEKAQLTQEWQKQQETLQAKEQQCKVQEKQLDKQEKLLLEEREKNQSQKTEIETLGQQLTQATELLAGYAPPKSGSGMKRSSSLPTCVTAKP